MLLCVAVCASGMLGWGAAVKAEWHVLGGCSSATAPEPLSSADHCSNHDAWCTTAWCMLMTCSAYDAWGYYLIWRSILHSWLSCCCLYRAITLPTLAITSPTQTHAMLACLAPMHEAHDSKVCLIRCIVTSELATVHASSPQQHCVSCRCADWMLAGFISE